MVRRVSQNHPNDCSFCLVNLTGFDRYKKRKREYPDLASARLPVLHSKGIPVPVFTSLSQLQGSNSEETNVMKCCKTSGSSCGEYEESSSSPKSFTKGELSNLITDLNLSKQASQLLASRPKEKTCLDPKTKITLYRKRKKDLPYFKQDENLVYCTDIHVHGLLNKMQVLAYRPDNWRIFIDSSTRSLKSVLLHNKNHYASFPIAHSIKLKEEYDNIKLLL